MGLPMRKKDVVMSFQVAYLLLGANLGSCAKTFALARREISEKAGRIVRASHLYNSPAWGFSSPDVFYNQVLEVQTELDPFALLRELLQIERRLGRVRPLSGQEEGGREKGDGSDGASGSEGLRQDGLEGDAFGPGIAGRDEAAGEGKAYASRVIDIDVLLYGNAVISSRDLTVPHPLLPQRAFALVPLCELAPDLVHPALGVSMRELLEKCPDEVASVRLCENEKLLFPSCGRVPARDGETGDGAPFGDLRFLAIEGNIGAGKTSLSRKIAGQFGAKLVLESFEENVFLPKFYQNKERYAFPLELAFLAERYRQAKEDFVQELFSPFIVSDFSISKSLIFAQNTLQEDEYALFSRLFGIILTTIPKPDLYVYLHSDVDRLMRNIRLRARSYEQDMDPAYLRRIEEGYLAYVKTLPPGKGLVIDVTDMDFVNREQDYEEILHRIGLRA